MSWCLEGNRLGQTDSVGAAQKLVAFLANMVGPVQEDSLEKPVDSGYGLQVTHSPSDYLFSHGLLLRPFIGIDSQRSRRGRGGTSAKPAMSGPELLTNAARHLAGYPTISARIRNRVSMFGQKLVGSGSYQQSRTGRLPMWRIELSTKSWRRRVSV